MRKVERQMRTLDSIVAARGDAITYNLLKARPSLSVPAALALAAPCRAGAQLTRPIFLLLQCDVQGAELDVIRGAKRTLENIDVVILEARGAHLTRPAQATVAPPCDIRAHRRR